ncbi:hypothetical protein TEA_020653 [Camellia sinensis var. sinensis]|uniref:EGF-like domain-containing protein n=1 Tax=Camellia sinensis var. sinensis TaxID=542762 RepID=A0A4S4DC86_CAMSN|nr:hypothetical protein TEA_020653 [Camellia sinensis var. sinensis]
MASSQGMQLQLQPINMMLVLVQLVVVVIFSLSAATIAAPTEQELKNLGCTNRCGNLDISYPFGMEANCSLNDNFFINCSDSQPYLPDGNIVVTNISLEDGELRIMQFVASECYNASGYLLPNSFDASLTLSKFSISNSKNKFTAIGCDTSGSVQITDKNGSLLATGCLSQCSNINSVPNDGSCSGIGCCQTSIPKGVGRIEISVNSFSHHKNITNFNPCSYAFVVEDGAFIFSTTYLKEFKAEKLPMVLDWGIGDNETCEEAKKNQTSYACGDNSDCYEAEIGLGYICKCSKGYEGNAYLSDGCKGVGHIEISVTSFSNHSNITYFKPCGYAFGVVDGAFNFSTTYLKDFKSKEVPTLLDWGIGDDEKCEEAKKNQTSYACGDNSDCYEAEIGHGYICKCSKGYEGIVYSDGCKGY